MKQKINLFQIVGLLLILSSFAAVFLLQINEKKYEKEAKALVNEIEICLPTRRGGNTTEHTDAQMPILQIDGQDFIGLLEAPMQDMKLPIYGQWEKNKISAYPCRFWGSAYDASLMIGGTDAKGQMDFLTKVELGESVIVTDMTGASFSYQVERVDRSKTASAEKLYEEEDDLTLFVRDKDTQDYVIVRCKTSYQ